MMHHVLETTRSGRLAFRGRGHRAKYRADRYAEECRASGKNVAVHSFPTVAAAAEWVKEFNAKFNKKGLPVPSTTPATPPVAAPQPAVNWSAGDPEQHAGRRARGFILNSGQAEAAYSAMRALNNVGAKLRTEMSGMPDFSIVTVHERASGKVVVEGDRGVREEIYPDQTAFATAYGLSTGA